MTHAAAPPQPGRRASWGTVAVLVAYLVVAPPLFLLGPLLILLALSRPRSLREWLWLALAAVAAVALGNPLRGGLGSLVLASGAAFLSGAFGVACHLRREWSTLSRAAAATGAAGAALVAWGAATGVTFAAVDAAVRADLTRAIQLFFEGAPAEQLNAVLASAEVVATLFPGIVVLQALGGTGLAWVWYHHVATRPVGRRPRRFRDFRFNDHLVWGAIFTLAATLLPLGDGVARIAANGLVVWAGLYAARGLAVAVALAARWPLAARVLAVGLAVLALPFAGATLVTVGLIDTWQDFRGRLASPPSGDEA